MENGFRPEFYGIDMTSEDLDMMSKTPASQDELHVFEEDPSLFTKSYRCEILFDTEEELMSPEASLGGSEEDYNIQEPTTDDVPETPTMDDMNGMDEMDDMGNMDEMFDEEMMA
ncbi:MAG: hypothetical protein ACOCQG_03475 [Candidatus Nanoarchaeia archaeon]